MGVIEEKCPELKTSEGANGALAEAQVRLPQGPVVIGEAHNEPYARAVVMDLVDVGLIKKLFIEMEDLPIDRGAFPAIKEETLSAYLNRLVDEGTVANLDEDPVWKVYAPIVNTTDKSGIGHPNNIPLTAVMRFAILHKTRVYFHEIDSRKTFPERHEKSGEYFEQHSGPGEQRVALLVGGAHTEGIDSIQKACGIGDKFTYDFSRYNLTEHKLAELKKAASAPPMAPASAPPVVPTLAPLTLLGRTPAPGADLGIERVQSPRKKKKNACCTLL